MLKAAHPGLEFADVENLCRVRRQVQAVDDDRDGEPIGYRHCSPGSRESILQTGITIRASIPCMLPKHRSFCATGEIRRGTGGTHLYLN